MSSYQLFSLVRGCPPKKYIRRASATALLLHGTDWGWKPNNAVTVPTHIAQARCLRRGLGCPQGAEPNLLLEVPFNIPQQAY